MQNFCSHGYTCNFPLASQPSQNYKRLGLEISAQVDVLKGHDFSRTGSAAKSALALAPEEMLGLG
jgi:hypothetical protein